MAGLVTARFLVDRPIRPGTVRAILDTLTAQGGAYEPHLVRRSPGELRRIAGVRPASLLNEVGEGGTQTAFMRVAEARPQPVLTFSVSRTPRTHPTEVMLSVPSEALDSSQEVDRLLGVCKGLYLFLESFWGAAGLVECGPMARTDLTSRQPRDAPPTEHPRQSGVSAAASGVSATASCDRKPTDVREQAGSEEPEIIRWANFFGPEFVSTVGVARLLTSVAFILEILPDGGVMMVTHPSPDLAESPAGVAMRAEIERTLDLQRGGEGAGLIGRQGSWAQLTRNRQAY